MAVAWPAHFAPVLRRVIFIGKPALGQRLNFQRVGLNSELRMRANWTMPGFRFVGSEPSTMPPVMVAARSSWTDCGRHCADKAPKRPVNLCL